MKYFMPFVMLLICLTYVSATGSLETGLISWYTCDGIGTINSSLPDSTELNDLSITSSPLVLKTGIINTACSNNDDASGTYMSGTFNGFNLSDSFTICAWSNISATTGGFLFEYRESGTAYAGINAYTGGFYPTSLQYQGYYYPDAIVNVTQKNQIKHTCWTYSYPDVSSSSRLYINGQLITQGKANYTPKNFSGGTAYMMRNIDYGFTNYINGWIDEIGVWNRALTPSEISQLWNSGNGLGYNDVVATSQSLSFNVSPVSQNYVYKDGSYKVYPIGQTNCQQVGSATICDVINQSIETWQLNSNVANGYADYICDFKSSSGVNVYDITFDTCLNTTSCGFLPSNSAYTWYTGVWDNVHGLGLNIYNDSFSFGKYVQMPNIVADSSYDFDTDVSFIYKAGVGSGTVFTLLSPYNQNLVNVYVTYDGVNQCYYSVDNPVTLAGQTLLYCALFDGTTYTDNDIHYYLSDTHKWQIQTVCDGIIYKSGIITQATYNYSIAGFLITSQNNSNATFVDDIIVTNNNLSSRRVLDAIQIPFQFSCTYDVNKCYTTRTYFSSISPNDDSNYLDRIVCGTSSQQSASTLSQDEVATNFLNDLFGVTDSTPMSTKMTIAFWVVIVTFIITIILIWATTGSGGLSMLLASVLSGTELVIFTTLKYFPAWVLVMLIILVAGILMVIGRKIISGD